MITPVSVACLRGRRRCVLGLLGVALGLLTTSCTQGVHSEAEAATLMLRHVEKHHYSNVSVDDRVSLKTLDNYLERLDRQRLYFTVEDVESLRAGYGQLLDDAIRQGQLGPAREIYDLYRRRRADHLDFVLGYLEARPDLNTARQWIPGRDKEPWPANRAELARLWQDQVRHEFINLMLEDRRYETAHALLHHRFRRARESDALRTGSYFRLFMNSFARALDPHSHYRLREPPDGDANAGAGEDFDGRIGITLEDRKNGAVIEDVVPGAPAAGQGLKPGDRIVAMDIYGDGRLEDVENWSPRDVGSLSRGSAGTTLVVRVLPADRESEAFEASLKRAKASQVYEEARSLSPDLPDPDDQSDAADPERSNKRVMQIDQDGRTLRIGVISLPRFYGGSARDIKRLLGELKSEGVDGMLLDLRNNPGGRMKETLRIIGLFVGKGPVGYERDRKGQLKVKHSATWPATWGGPLAVLVNERSASGAEIFAAAMQDHGRAVVVGQRTFGKSTGRVTFPIKVGAGDSFSEATMGITTFMFYRLTGRSIHRRGVHPDIELPAAGISWPSAGLLALVSDPLNPELRSSESLMPDETINADFNRANASRLQVAALAARHRQRASRERRWRMMEERLELIPRINSRSPVALSLEKRREEQLAQCTKELEQARAWIEESEPGPATIEPAQAEFLRQRGDTVLPPCLATNLDDSALLRALFTARGFTLLPAEQGYEFESYDLPLEQSARIVADMVRSKAGSAPAA